MNQSNFGAIFHFPRRVWIIPAGRIEFRDVRGMYRIMWTWLEIWLRTFERVSTMRNVDDDVWFLILICVLHAKTGSDEKKPTSLERVEELSGKTVDFHNVDINDAESLDKIFKLVTNILSSFFSPLTLKLIKIIVSFIFCPTCLVSIWLRHSFGRFEISRWFVQFATWLLPE